MTFNVGTIAGGTHAGWRKVKPAPKRWRHYCTEGVERELAAHHVRCPDCKAPRADFDPLTDAR